MNKVILVGNVTKELEMSSTNNGSQFTKFGLATNETYTKDGEKVKETEFHNIIFWNRLAETLVQYVKKGAKLLIEGKIKTRNYEVDGTKRYFTEIIGEKFEFLTSKKEYAEPAKENKEVPF